MKSAKPIILSLALPLVLGSCASERTVYDQYGKVVKESKPLTYEEIMGEGAAAENRFYSTMEERFNAAFSQKKNKDGVPESSSTRTSRYQKDIDAARSGGKEYVTKQYGGASRSSLRDKAFAGSSKTFDGRKAYAGAKKFEYAKNLRPDFLNGNKGLAHQDYQGDHAGKRSGWEARRAPDAGRQHVTRDSSYNSHDRSGYVQSRESRREQPTIRDHTNPNSTSIEDTRRMLGRDQKTR